MVERFSKTAQTSDINHLVIGGGDSRALGSQATSPHTLPIQIGLWKSSKVRSSLRCESAEFPPGKTKIGRLSSMATRTLPGDLWMPGSGEKLNNDTNCFISCLVVKLATSQCMDRRNNTCHVLSTAQTERERHRERSHTRGNNTKSTAAIHIHKSVMDTLHKASLQPQTEFVDTGLISHPLTGKPYYQKCELRRTGRQEGWIQNFYGQKREENGIVHGSLATESHFMTEDVVSSVVHNSYPKISHFGFKVLKNHNLDCEESP
uniref:Uncharacterized protein n=1 Tax=Coccidioides posadasii RMSCC 3488 TaxID=454284 RepID=A0A0J6I1R0_COCPO|nr:hypothetical protein CPAG_01568 [Coccidioides posadasii RMSCC 3488]